MAEVLYKHGRYEIHLIHEDPVEDEEGELCNLLVWDDEQRAFLQYGVYNVVTKVYEAYTPVEGSAIIMAIEYQDLLDASRELLANKEKGGNLADFQPKGEPN